MVRLVRREIGVVHRLGVMTLTSCLLAAPSDAQEVNPRQGERIRVELTSDPARSLSLPSPWEGTFIMVQEQALVGNSPVYGAVRFPLGEIEAVQVERERTAMYAVAVGAGAGTAFGVGMWQFLKILCRSGCDAGLGSAWLPASIAGGLVGLLVGVRASSARRWVPASLPR